MPDPERERAGSCSPLSVLVRRRPAAPTHLAAEGPRDEQLERLPLQLHQAGVAILAPDAAVGARGGASSAAGARRAGAEAWRASQRPWRAGADPRGRRARRTGEGARRRGARAGRRRAGGAQRGAGPFGGWAVAGPGFLVSFPVPAFRREGRLGLGGAGIVHLPGGEREREIASRSMVEGSKVSRINQVEPRSGACRLAITITPGGLHIPRPPHRKEIRSRECVLPTEGGGDGMLACSPGSLGAC